LLQVVDYISARDLLFMLIIGGFLADIQGQGDPVVLSRSFATTVVGRVCGSGLKQNRIYALNRELKYPALFGLQANISDPGYMIRELECSDDGVTLFGGET